MGVQQLRLLVSFSACFLILLIISWNWANLDSKLPHPSSKFPDVTGSVYPRSGHLKVQLREPRHEICLLSNIRNTPRLLIEWLEYHHLLGIDHFFINNQCSDDGDLTTLVIDSFQSWGIVSVLNLAPSEVDCKKASYERWLDLTTSHIKDKGICKWLGVLDVNEYITVDDNRQSSVHLLRQIVEGASLPLIKLWSIEMGPVLSISRIGFLCIEQSTCGQFTQKFNGVFVKTSLIQAWSSLRQPLLNNTVVQHWQLDQLIHAQDPQLQSFQQYIYVSKARPWEYQPFRQGGQDYARPKSGLCLKRYKYRSFEEYVHYQLYRLRKNLTEADVANSHLWNEWLRSSEAPCYNIADQFTANMAQRVRQRLESHERPPIADERRHQELYSRIKDSIL